MATYLLLRNNKETGPLTLQQLLELGLKPYDLVWVESKSAAWRYPSEISELKKFAPVVEEQPFDRFYKKTAEDKHFFEIIEESRNKTEAHLVKISELKTEKISPKVFVSLPGHQSEPDPVIEIKRPEPVMVIEEKRPSLAEQKLPTFSPPGKKEEIKQPEKKTELKQEYSQPLDEIKKQYVEKYLSRKQKTIRKQNFVKLLQLAGAAVFVLALGTLVYFTVKPDRNLNTTGQSVLQDPGKNINGNTGGTIDQTVFPDEQTLSGTIQENISSENDEMPVSTEPAKQPVQKQVNKPDEKNNSSGQVEMVQNNTPVPLQTDPANGERNKMVRNNAAKKKQQPAEINSLVSVKANEYKRKAFGGIENLQLTVNNSSSYILDKVLVELQYLKPSEQPLKTETIEFSSIAPNGSMTIKIPDNPRGIKVAYKILQVESSQYDKTTAGL